MLSLRFILEFPYGFISETLHPEIRADNMISKHRYQNWRQSEWFTRLNEPY